MKFHDLPENSGVYIIKDKNNNPIYIGKAFNIRSRIESHFQPKNNLLKQGFLSSQASKVESIRVDSEIEALILEANLIKKYQPKYNSLLKDDKDYLYIKITKDEFPKVLAARRKDLTNTKTHFGPFPSSSKVRLTLRILRKLFPYSNCKRNQNKACFNFHIGLCPGVCIGLINKNSYKKNIKNIIEFLNGKTTFVINSLEKELRKLTKNYEYEKASEVKRKIDSINYITSPVHRIEFINENIENKIREELSELKRQLNLKKIPSRIECFDVSNISGREATGSMIVFSRGFANKSEYRRFKIKNTVGINDVAMLTEVLIRRFQNEWKRPDLIIVDGGIGQLNAALRTIKILNINIPAISIAKKHEDVYQEGLKTPLRLDKSNDALKLIQRIRDEAHRFAVTYHRKLRSKKLLLIN